MTALYDHQDIFHIGMLVTDIDRAMREHGAAMGITWARVQHSDARSIWTPEAGLGTAALTFTYSCEGPQHVELLQGGIGSIWDGANRNGLHHIGVWTDDVHRDVDRFVAEGWRLSAAARTPEEGFGAFAYMTSPDGLIVELVSSAARSRFDAWFAGGSLGSDR